MSWTKEWPKEPGLYWFYGHRSPFSTGSFELGVVRAHLRGSVIVIEGMLQLGFRGHFQKLDPPTLPEEG